MFSHEGPALELLLFIFGLAGLLLVVWFFTIDTSERTGKA